MRPGSPLAAAATYADSMSLWRMRPAGAASATSWPLRGSTGRPVSSAAHGPVAITTCRAARRSPEAVVTLPASAATTSAPVLTATDASMALAKPAGST